MTIGVTWSIQCRFILIKGCHHLAIMKMFRLEHETMNVCQRNVIYFVHVECRFDKIKGIFQGFGSLVSFSLVQSTQLSGKLSRLKNKHERKNVHASWLNANGSKDICKRYAGYDKMTQ